MKNLLKSCFLVLALLSGCGGSGAATPIKVYSQPSDRTIPTTGYDAQIRIVDYAYTGRPLPPVDVDVAQQAALGPNVILTVGGKTREVLERLPALLAEAQKYPGKFQWAYVYDEACLTPVLGDPCPDKAEIIQAAKLMRAAGFKVLVTIFPDTINHPAFDPELLHYVDGVSLDIYPSIRMSNNLYGCRYGDNLIENILMCTIDKMRRLGFKGDIGYIWQAFARHAESLETSLAHAALQRPVIDNAMRGKYDITAVMPWGLYIGADEQRVDYDMNPLGGSPYEYLVLP